MNERIYELAIECATNLDWDNPSVDPNEFCYNKQALEKFAELIVKECAGVGYDASYYECALNVSNKIKQHFGVEE